MQIIGEGHILFLFFEQTNRKNCAKNLWDVEMVKKREEPAVSKLGSLLQFKTTPSVFFLKNNIFYF